MSLSQSAFDESVGHTSATVEVDQDNDEWDPRPPKFRSLGMGTPRNSDTEESELSDANPEVQSAKKARLDTPLRSSGLDALAGAAAQQDASDTLNKRKASSPRKPADTDALHSNSDGADGNSDAGDKEDHSPKKRRTDSDSGNPKDQDDDSLDKAPAITNRFDDKDPEEHIQYDPKDWQITDTELQFNAYIFYLSPGWYIPLWGSNRCPAVARIGLPYSADNPLMLYPGKYVFNKFRPEAHYIFIEAHYHAKSQKKANTFLCYIPKKFRTEVSMDDLMGVKLQAAMFAVLPVHCIDWDRTERCDPASCKWGQMGPIRAALEELTALDKIPTICHGHHRPLETNPPPVSQNVNIEEEGDPAAPITKTKPRPSRGSRGRNRDKKTIVEANINTEDNDVSGAQGDTNPEAPNPPPTEKPKPNRGKGGNSRSGSSSRQSSATQKSSGASALLTSAITPATLQAGSATSVVLRGLTEDDKTWLRDELKILANTITQHPFTHLRMDMAGLWDTHRRELIKVAEDTNRNLTDIVQKVQGVATQNAEILAESRKQNSTPTYSWQQIVDQCEQFQKMFATQMSMISNKAAFPALPLQQPPYGPPPSYSSSGVGLGGVSSTHYGQQPFPHQSGLQGQGERSSFYPPSYTHPAPYAQQYGGTTSETAMSGTMFPGQGPSFPEAPKFRVRSSPGQFFPYAVPPEGSKKVSEDITVAASGESPLRPTGLGSELSAGLASNRGSAAPGQAAPKPSDQDQITALTALLPHMTKEQIEQLVRQQRK